MIKSNPYRQMDGKTAVKVMMSALQSDPVRVLQPGEELIVEGTTEPDVLLESLSPDEIALPD